ncbi:UDP-2,3-diacylglucosamine diphosphatase [Shewanella pneumatophori]|uniref:UDP-2,3-diacylglucosamine diphosphatase n=1 Tax=Shewanella pneumatophori TaxID=314092 RepID=A0A9X1ZIL1_9GAMM|nr:UDP-2,3-diacylglucosamine diphosphatase [Shewanella pneumatophori]MCL1138463.1 UDP-2,3-diacylglucosamine diphosphatase [Shewanella pneumatophori]
MSTKPTENRSLTSPKAVPAIIARKTRQSFNALWLSDLHLGSKDCKAEYLLQLLKQVDTESLYLVGDIFDVWALKRRIYWPESHNKVLQQLLKMARDGVNIVYIPGNHDEILKPYSGFHLWDLSIANEYIHIGVSGRKILMLHGDQFDSEVCVGRTYAKLGDHLYDLLLFLNRGLHQVRNWLGYPYWSLASYIKLKINKAQQAINDYQAAVIRYANSKTVDAVVCGHIHQPALELNNKILYANDGDWVENCTLIAESTQGEIQLLKWDEIHAEAKLVKSYSFDDSEQTPQQQQVA